MYLSYPRAAGEDELWVTPAKRLGHVIRVLVFAFSFQVERTNDRMDEPRGVEFFFFLSFFLLFHRVMAKS